MTMLVLNIYTHGDVFYSIFHLDSFLPDDLSDACHEELEHGAEHEGISFEEEEKEDDEGEEGNIEGEGEEDDEDYQGDLNPNGARRESINQFCTQTVAGDGALLRCLIDHHESSEEGKKSIS